MSIEFSKPLAVRSIDEIPGLLVVDLPVYGDNRGWFKENWQREHMVAMGLPDFQPVQNNISYNEFAGTTRGIHAEPWDKFVSVSSGRIFGAWVDLREGPTFGNAFCLEVDASTAVFVPRGVGNAFQTLEDATTYSYLVNDHWSKNVEYSFLNLADQTVCIPWPYPLSDSRLSEKDRNHPALNDVVPVSRKKILVLGASGQLGSALKETYSDIGYIDFKSRSEFDFAISSNYDSITWSDYSVVINAGAFTDVDGAETTAGRINAWKTNVTGLNALSKRCNANNIIFVHISSDYVFDGSHEIHDELEPVSPLSVYGQTKAAGEFLASQVQRHYIIRTSWVIGNGINFVRTMRDLALRGIKPKVVNDQIGRLTFANELADFIRFAIEENIDYGIYNFSNTGQPQSWASIARFIFAKLNVSPDHVTNVTTVEYYADKIAASRPLNSTFDLRKITNLGFTPSDQLEALSQYLDGLAAKTQNSSNLSEPHTS